MLRLLSTLALGPVLLVQGRRVRAKVPLLPEPTGPRCGTEALGAGAPLRLLIAGDSSAAGVGARRQDDALARPLALQLGERLQRPVQWELIARIGWTTQDVLHALKHHLPSPLDAAVIITGVNDVTRRLPPAAALRQRAALLDLLRSRAQVEHVVFTALPPMQRFPALPQPLAWYLGREALHHTRALAAWVRGQARTSFIDPFADGDPAAPRVLFSDDGFHPSPALYAHCAARLSEHLAAISQHRETT